LPRSFFPPLSSHQCSPVEHLTVGVDLPGQSRQSILIALDFPPADLAVDDSDIDSVPTSADPQLMSNQRVDIS
jgi:hypothetical protein